MSSRLPPVAWIERWADGVLRLKPTISHRQIVVLFRPAVELYSMRVSARQAAAVVTGDVPRLVQLSDRHEAARRLKNRRN